MIKKAPLLLIFILLSQWTFISAQIDPNNNPNWDWRVESTYMVYPSEQPSGVGTISPFQFPGISEAVQDNKPEDGWVLVQRNFGTPDRTVPVPYFVLYNKYQGLLRIFIIPVMTGNSFTKGMVTIQWGSDLKTLALNHIRPTAWGEDKLDSGKYNSSASYTSLVNYNWTFADFPIAYESNLSSFQNVRLLFELWGSVTSNVTLNISGDILQTFGNNQPSNLPTSGFFQSGGMFQIAQKAVQGTQSTWLGWQQTISNMAKSINDTTKPSLRNLKNAINKLSNSWLLSNFGAIGVGVGFLDFFISGGRITETSKPAPMSFKANFKATGTISTDYKVAGSVTLPLPGTPQTENITATQLLYKNPLGVLSIKETPVLQHRKYDKPTGPYSTRETHSFIIKKDLVFNLNPSSDLEIVDIKAALIYEPSTASIANEFLDYANDSINHIDNTPIKLESATDGVYVFSTPYVNAYAVKYQKITIPAEAKDYSLGNPQGDGWFPGGINISAGKFLGKVYLKIFATLRVKNSPSNRQPVLFIAKYNCLVEEGDGINAPWPNPPATFAVNVTRTFETGIPEVLTTQYGYIGKDNVTVTTPLNINNSNFGGWSDGVSAATRAFTNNTNLIAYYKLSARSDSKTAFSNPGQRKFIRTPDGFLHIVYESMNKIWYERSTDGGVTWIIQNNGKPINNDYIYNKQTGVTTGTGSYTTAKQPAIDYLGNKVITVWQEQSGTSYVIRLCVLNNGLPVNIANDIPFKSYGQYTEDITPEIVVKDNNYVMIAIRRNDAFLKGIECHYSIINTYTGVTTEAGAGYIQGTNEKSKNFSLATHRSSQDLYHLAWQQDGTSSSSVYYSRFNFKYVDNGTLQVMGLNNPMALEPGNGTWQLQILKNVNISAPTYNNYNYSPSVIAAADGTARVSFKGYYEYDPGYGSYTMSLVNPDNFSYIPYLNKYGGDIFSSQLSLGSETYFMGWTEYSNNAFRTICTDSQTLRDMETVNNAIGKDFQINNGGTKLQQFVMSFNSENSTLPFSFRRSDAIGNIVVNKKNFISSGRSIFLTKDNAQFHFTLGNVNADGIYVNFVDVKDTVNLDRLEKANQYLITDPFNINDNSSFTFAVSYGTKDSVLAKSRFQDDKYASFKVELVDAISGKVLGSYLDVKLSKDNIYKMIESSYKVSCGGVGNQLVRLRLLVDENLNFQYTISDMLLGKGILLSKSSAEEKVVNYNGTFAVKDFALEQNYPNPFNPSTVINYALPKASYVSLKVYDILGKEVRTLVNEYKVEGMYSVKFNANSLPSGIYIYQIKAGNNIASRKMILIK